MKNPHLGGFKDDGRELGLWVVASQGFEPRTNGL